MEISTIRWSEILSFGIVGVLSYEICHDTHALKPVRLRRRHILYRRTDLNVKLRRRLLRVRLRIKVRLGVEVRGVFTYRPRRGRLLSRLVFSSPAFIRFCLSDSILSLSRTNIAACFHDGLSLYRPDKARQDKARQDKTS